MGQNTSHIISEKLERLGRLLASNAYDGGLNPAQWNALRYLSIANRFSRTPKGMTAYLNATKGTVSQTIAALEKKGMLEKITSSTDKRQVFLNLTKRAHILLKSDPQKDIADIVTKLPASSRDSLHKALDIILHQKLSRNDGKAFGICNNCKHFSAEHDLGSPHYCRLLSEPLSSTDASYICAEQDAA